MRGDGVELRFDGEVPNALGIVLSLLYYGNLPGNASVLAINNVTNHCALTECKSRCFLNSVANFKILVCCGEEELALKSFELFMSSPRVLKPPLMTFLLSGLSWRKAVMTACPSQL